MPTITRSTRPIAAPPAPRGPSVDQVKRDLAESLPLVSNFEEATNGQPSKVPAGVAAFQSTLMKQRPGGAALELNVIQRNSADAPLFVVSEPERSGRMWVVNAQGQALASGAFNWRDGSLRWDQAPKAPGR